MIAREQSLVSVIVPVYNVERYLDCCMDSIRGQTYERLEIIVVEDCSTDASLARLRPHLSDPRVRLIRHKRNLGLSAARNTGIEAATGDYVIFVDSDDAIAPALVATCVTHAVDTHADVVLFDFLAFPDGKPLPEIREAAGATAAQRPQGPEYFRLPHFAWLKLIRSSLLRQHSITFPVGYQFEDHPFHWHIGLHAERIVAVHSPLYYYRKREGSITSRIDVNSLDVFEMYRQIAKLLESHSAKPVLHEVLFARWLQSAWFTIFMIQKAHLPVALRRARKVHIILARPSNTRIRVCARHRILRWILSSESASANIAVNAIYCGVSMYRRVLEAIAPRAL